MSGRPSPADRPLKLALYSGLCVRFDAISSSLLRKLDAVDRWRAAGADVHATAFVQHCDFDHPRIVTVSDVSQLIRRTEFSEADIHIFEFGIAYPLFDAVFLLPPEACTVGIYHNLTPPELVDDPIQLANIERSLIQRHNLAALGHVACDSEFNRRQLEELGIPPDRLSVLGLPPFVTSEQPPPEKPSGSGIVNLLYVGRFVRAKGIVDLMEAADRLQELVPGRFRLTMAGNPFLSSPDLTEALERYCESRTWARLFQAPIDRELVRMFEAADVLVMPSYHEGLCLPVLEGLSRGCRVVAYDSSNLPYVHGGLGLSVPTGDVSALVRVLHEELERGPKVVLTDRGKMDRARWKKEVAHHLAAHSGEAFERSFRALVERLASRTPAAS